MSTVLHASLIIALLAATELAKPRVWRDLPYVEGGGRDQQLDLYLPPSPSSTLVVFVHGGSLTSGDKRDEDYGSVCLPFVAANLQCATVNYRLFPSVKWPAPAQDVARAVAWLKARIPDYGGRVDRLFLFGHSSGCLLASLLGTDARYLREVGSSLGDVAGVVAMGCRLNGVTELPAGVTPEQVAEHFRRDPYDAAFGSVEALNDAVPTRHVSAAMAPHLILIAEAERLQPPIEADAKAFIAAAQRVGGKAEMLVLEGTKHLSALKNMAAGPADPGLQAILRFVGRQ